MDNLLPTEFDVIIVGSGLVESIISAAASRVGKRVLLIDRDNNYGGLWASFNLDAIQTIGANNNPHINDVDCTDLLKDGEAVHKICCDKYNIQNFSYKWYIPEKIEVVQPVKQEAEQIASEPEETSSETVSVSKPEWNQADILKQSRKFNIDLTPKLQYARGDLIELLISSNVARYSTYVNVSRVVTWLNGQLEMVPCSRSDVFANNKVSVIEKRMLMKLLTSVLNDNSDEFKAVENKTFRSFLKEKKLTPNLVHYVLYAISMSTDNTPCLEGARNTKRFVNSLGRFGQTPFIFSLYGSGEISQAFCRLSAVFGGICALSQPLNGIVVDSNNKFKSLLCDKQRIDAEYIVMGAEKTPEKFLNVLKIKYISRAIFITDRSIMPSEKQHITLMLYPREGGKELCTILELGGMSGTCPENLFVIHMITKQTASPEEDFKECVQNLFEAVGNVTDEELNGKPHVLWSCYFSVPDSNDLELQSSVPDNVFVCPGPDADLDYDESINKAKEIFSKLYPDLEFLPRAPDPEEIVYEGEDTKENDSSLETDNKEIVQESKPLENDIGEVLEKNEALVSEGPKENVENIGKSDGCGTEKADLPKPEE